MVGPSLSIPSAAEDREATRRSKESEKNGEGKVNALTETRNEITDDGEETELIKTAMNGDKEGHSLTQTSIQYE